jgi:hypothetical protein
MNRIRTCAALVLLAVAVSACQAPPDAPKYPAIRFTDGPPIRLNVGRIQVVEAYRPPLAAPNVEHDFPVRPMAALAQWARDRLQAAGTDGRAEVVIRDASVKEVDLKKSTGVRGALTTDQSERYDAAVEVEVRIIDGQNRERARASARAKRSRTVPEDITLIGREQVWYAMTVKIMKTIDEALRRQIDQSLTAYIE